MWNLVIILDDVFHEVGLNEPRLTHAAFEKRIRSMIETQSLTDLELKKILLDPEVKFVPLNRNRCLNLPSASIVLPVYNNENVVNDCLETLVHQTYRNVIEIIVVDDGSTDGSLIILKEFENTHPLVRIIASRHLGRSAARNIGLKNVKGEIVLFAESDALYAPWYLEKAVDLFKTKNIDAVMLQGSWILNLSLISKCILIMDQIKWGQILAGKREIISAWVYKTDIVRQIEGFDEKLESGEDKELLRRVKLKDGRIEYGTGYYWFHPTPNGLKQYLQRILDYQIKKASQHRNRKKSRHLLIIVILLIIIYFIVTFIRPALDLLLYFLPYALLTPFLLFYFVRLFHLLREHKNVSYNVYIFILPIISILAIFPKLLGKILGKWRHFIPIRR